MDTISTRIHRKKDRYPVLVVDSDPDQWLILRSVFTQCFPEIEPVWKNHTPQALTYLKAASTNPNTTPRLIFLNPFAPSLQEGWDLLKQIKSGPCSTKIPVIVLSFSEEPEDILQAYSLGAASYITKPSSHAKMRIYFYTLRKYWWEMVKLPAKEFK